MFVNLRSLAQQAHFFDERSPVGAPAAALFRKLSRLHTCPPLQRPMTHAKTTFNQHELVGSSVVMQQLRTRIERIALTQEPVLIYGETGTGKESVARAIYEKSPVGKFVVVDCTNLSTDLIGSELFGHVRGAFTGAVTAKVGLLEEANNGTVFLDEIGELPLECQGKLLRAIQEKQIRPVGSTHSKAVSWRVVAATNRDLGHEVRKGHFREDLYYRLNVLKLRVPALRERKEDIPELIAHFLSQRSISHKVPPDVLRILMNNRWIGNVRQLQSCIRSMVVEADGSSLSTSGLPATIHEDSQQNSLDQAAHSVSGDFPIHVSDRGSEVNEDRPQSLAEVERSVILNVLQKCRGDRTAAAALLHIGRTTLYRKLTEYGVKASRAQNSSNFSQ